MIISNKTFYRTIFAITIVKLLLIYFIPLTGDEAYFTQWAKYLDYGFYDHPPMIGWTMYLMGLIDFNIVFFRLVAIITGFFVAYVLYELSNFYVEDSGKFVALIFLISPLSLMLVLMTNDIVLLLFSTLSVLFFFKSYVTNNKWFALLSGVFLGLAFLSKYFAVFIALGFLVFTLIKKDKNLFLHLFIVFLGVLPFGLQNLIYNYNSCWNNVLFNLVARTKNSSLDIKTIVEYLVVIIYLITPWGIWYLLKVKEKITKILYPFVILSVPLIIFLIVSLKNSVGLHWLWSFVPYGFILFAILEKQEQEKAFKYTAIFTGIHVVFLFTLLLLPLSAFEKNREYSSIVMGSQPQKLCKILDRYDSDVFYADGYTPSAVLEYHCNKEFHVLFSQSKYGRQDDKNLDIRKLDGKDLYIFKQESVDKTIYKYFQEIKVDEYEVENSKFLIIKASGFKYDLYKNDILEKIKDNFYTVPDWLPVDRCYFKDRYFGE